MYVSCVSCHMFVCYACTHTCVSLENSNHRYCPSVCFIFPTCLRMAPNAVTLFQQAKKGLLTLTVRTRLTAPPSLCSHLSPPLCRSLSSSTCGAQDSSPFSLESPASPASTAKPNYRIMVEVSLQKGRSTVPAFAHRCPRGQHRTGDEADAIFVQLDLPSGLILSPSLSPHPPLPFFLLI